MALDTWQTQISVAWMIVVIAVGYALGPPSVAGWGIVAAAALILPVLVQRFWRRPEPSMSESIRDNLR